MGRSCVPWNRVGVGLFVSACSLTGPADFDTQPCRDDGDCEPATVAAGEDPRRCVAYTCNRDSGLCERAAPGGVERCDGTDNNCDGYIDEGTASSVKSIDACDPRKATCGTDSMNELPLAYSLAPDGSAYAALPGPQKTFGYHVGPGLTQEPKELIYECEGGSYSNKLGSICPSQNRDTHATSFDELALAVGAERLLSVAINRRGCAIGEVRIGSSTRADPFSFLIGKPSSVTSFDASNLGMEVELGVEPCTRGATLPAIASLEAPRQDRALALWLSTDAAPTLERGSCMGPEERREVQAMGVFSRTEDPRWLEAVAEARPTPIGWSTNWSAPAVVASSETGTFVVAFPGEGDAGRGLQLVSVGFANTAAAPLEVQRHGSFADREAHHAALAVGRQLSPNNRRMAAAWRSGCNSEVTLEFAEFTWNANELSALPTPTTLSLGNILRGPYLTYAAQGFFVGAPSGGWLVLWVERSAAGETRLKLARIAERKSRVLETRILASGAFELMFPYWEHSELRYAIVNETGATQSAWDSHSTECLDRG